MVLKLQNISELFLNLESHIAHVCKFAYINCELITRMEYKRELRTDDQMNLVVPLVKRPLWGTLF